MTYIKNMTNSLILYFSGKITILELEETIDEIQLFLSQHKDSFPYNYEVITTYLFHLFAYFNENDNERLEFPGAYFSEDEMKQKIINFIKSYYKNILVLEKLRERFSTSEIKELEKKLLSAEINYDQIKINNLLKDKLTPKQILQIDNEIQNLLGLCDESPNESYSGINEFN